MNTFIYSELQYLVIIMVPMYIVPALAIKNQHSLFETGSKNMLLKNVGMYIVLTWNM